MAANHTAIATVAGSGISHSSYSQVFSATPFGTTKIVIANSCDQNVAIAIGGAGSEVDLVCAAKGTSIVVDLGSINIAPSGVRIAAIAEGADASSGYLTVSLLP